MPTLEQLRRQIVADHDRLGALIVQYAATLDPQVREARDLLDAALREKTRILTALESSASSKARRTPSHQILTPG